MRIGFFSESYFPKIDGVTYTIESWRERLEERGHEVYIIYPDSPNYDPGENEIVYPSLPNPFYKGYRIPLPLGYGKIPELDIVHCHGPILLGRLGRRYAEKKDIPAVYTHHTPLEHYFEQSVKSKYLAELLGKLYVPWEERFLKKFGEVTASAGIKRDVSALEMPVGVDIEYFQPSDPLFDYEELTIGYSGRFSNEKNVCRLLELAGEIDGKIVLVGGGPKEEELREKAGENVEIREWLDREKLPNFYSSLDVFVTASTGDTLGLSVLEANACGTPVVAPDVHPFSQTVQERNGVVFEPGNSKDFASKIKQASQQSFNPRKEVEQYSLKSTVDRLEELYEDLKHG